MQNVVRSGKPRNNKENKGKTQTMGMSASQARLLTLTARLHDIEYKAQKLEAEKLRLANNSTRVYEDYLQALDATKIQYSALTCDGSITYLDATLNALENGVISDYDGITSNEILFLQNQDGAIIVTPAVAEKYGLVEGQDLGTLDEYLENLGFSKTNTWHENLVAHEKEVEDWDYVTHDDLSKIVSATPVENKLISTSGSHQEYSDTTYKLNGSLEAPTDTTIAATTSYETSGSVSAPTVTDPVTTELTKTVVTSGNYVTGAVSTSTTEGTSTLTSSTLTIPSQAYQTLTGITYTYSKDDLGLTLQELSDKYGWGMDFDDVEDNSSLNGLTVYWGNNVDYDFTGDYDTSTSFHYTADMTLDELLQTIADVSNGAITYDSDNGTLSSDENFFFISSDDSYLDDILRDYLEDNITADYGTAQNITLNTTLLELLFSNLNYTAYQNNKYTNGNLLSIYDASGSVSTKYKDSNGKNVSPSDDFTIADYFDYISNIIGEDVLYGTDADGNIIASISGGGYYFNAQSTYGETVENDYTQENTTDVTLNIDAIAENIYLAQSILAGTSESDYNSNHDSSISDIKTQLQNAYNSYSTDENKRQLALFSDALTEALSSGDTTKIQEALNLLGTTISSENYVNDETTTSKKSGSTTTVTTTQNTYTFTIVDNDVTLTPATKEVPDGEDFTKGTIRTIYSENDIKRYLAMSMYEADSSKTYEQYLSAIEGLGFSDYELVSLSSYIGTGDWDTIVNNLIKNTTKDSVSSYSGRYTSDEYDLTVGTMDNYTVTNTSTDAEYSVSCSNSKQDILTQLAYDLYNTYSNKFSTPDDAMSFLTGCGFSDSELASINYYYSNNKSTYNTILSNLAGGTTDVSNYDMYTGYAVSFGSSNKLSISSEDSYNTVIDKGTVSIPTIEGIASNIYVALVEAGYTDVTLENITSLLENKLGTDNDSNNITLANINEIVAAYINGNTSYASYIDNIYDYLVNGKTLDIPSTYTTTDYTATRGVSGTCSYTYDTYESYEQVGTHTETYYVDEGWYDEYWDTSNSDIANAIAVWTMAKRGFVIATDEQAASTTWLTNMIEVGAAVFTTFDISKADALVNYSSEEITNMSDTEYNDLMGIVNTSVSTNTSLREVSDETNLKKAEAKYEADMKKIDLKDRRYDTDLAAIETEREAIVDEIDTLKTVAKDNVDRTYKLFS